MNDCLVWKQFLSNGGTNRIALCRPFVDISKKISAHVLNFYSDSSMKEMGVIFGNRWLVQAWDKEFLQQFKPTIDFLELYALVATLLTWGKHPLLCNTKIVIFCDNQVVKNNINNLTTKSKPSLRLIRLLALNNLECNRRIMELKQFHHVTLDKEFINDCLIWGQFLSEVSYDNLSLCMLFTDINKKSVRKSLEPVVRCFYVGDGSNIWQQMAMTSME